MLVGRARGVALCHSAVLGANRRSSDKNPYGFKISSLNVSQVPENNGSSRKDLNLTLRSHSSKQSCRFSLHDTEKSMPRG
jgi:hypothetical protein